jgi:hypothetical protein
MFASPRQHRNRIITQTLGRLTGAGNRNKKAGNKN